MYRYQAYSEFLQDLCTPNETLLRKLESAPLLERNPALFWQLTAAALFLVVMAQWFIMSQDF
ncbi:MAG: hypothetical protein P8Y45_02155 [Exilibacterium sp.]